MPKRMKLFDVMADYKPKSDSNPHYYVFATSARDAKKIFSNRISWLNVYTVVEVEDLDAVEYISTHPYEYICIGSKEQR